MCYTTASDKPVMTSSLLLEESKDEEDLDLSFDDENNMFEDDDMSWRYFCIWVWEMEERIWM